MLNIAIALLIYMIKLTDIIQSITLLKAMTDMIRKTKLVKAIKT